MTKAMQGSSASSKANLDRTSPSLESPPSTDAISTEPVVPDPTKASGVDVRVTLILGGLTRVKAPVAIGARYDGLPFAGPTAAFDRLLDSWMTRAVDFGIIGSALGLLFPINLQQDHKAGRVKAQNLIIAGLGEPGRFAQDSLRFVISNVVVAVKAMGHNQFASTLLGTRRNELTIRDAIRGYLQGVSDGYERLRAVCLDLKADKDGLARLIAQPLEILLVTSNPKDRDEIEKELAWVTKQNPIPGLTLSVGRGPNVARDPKIERVWPSVEPQGQINYMRITRGKSAVAQQADQTPSPAATPRRGSLDPFPTEIFQFSALSDLAVVPQREQDVNAHLLHDAAARLTQDEDKTIDHERLGVYFADTVIPEDFRKLTEGPGSLTIEVDETTAIYPWEMIAHKRFAKTSFVSRNVAMSRQFRTLMSPPPTSPPPLNNQLKALVIADPAPGLLALSGARREGLAIVDVLEKARIAWGGRYDIKVKVRIGPGRDEQVERLLQILRTKGCVESAEPCDPLDLAMLIVEEQHDLIHYAGHGISKQSSGQTGWILASDCILSPKEIFRVRQVPRLVFANACFSAVTSDQSEMRKQITGLAQAYFSRGIPNFIGAGWTVDDGCAEECARWFYSSLMGLRSPDGAETDTGPATIGDALKIARDKTFLRKPQSASWGAYQHYGSANDRLIILREPPKADTRTTGQSAPPPETAAIIALHGGTPSAPPQTGDAAMTASASSTAAAKPAADRDLVYVNGIDYDTGTYAVPPQPIDAIAREVLKRPGLEQFSDLRSDQTRFAVPFGVDLQKPEEAGWGIIFHEDTPQDVRTALEPLIEHRRKQISANLVRELDYKTGEQTRSWYQRNHISPGSIDPETMPFYLLLVGGPELIPFEFQYLLGIDYGVGRLAFETAAEYEHYVRSIIAYETAKTVPNAKRISYWGTRHPGDPATNLSASLLIDPLANGIPDANGALKRPIHADVGYDRTLAVADDASKAHLLELLHTKTPPAMLFTASHGMQLRSGQAAQATTQGALLCQDWSGIGSVKPDHILAAADIADDANVNGLVAVIFACFGAGTPDVDQFLMDLSQAGTATPLAPKPFIAALPRRLLTHPNGSALAVIGHVDRAWGFSIQSPKVAEPQILPFRNSLGFIMKGTPIGFSMSSQFAARYAALSALLLNATSPTALPGTRPSDRELVSEWLERNDSQNYVLLGDPAARIHNEALS